MGHPLDGSVAKVKRASVHLESLHEAIRRFSNAPSPPYQVVIEIDPENARCLGRLRVEREPPIEWSLIAGDFVQNLRAALDHLVWQLVLANGGKPSRRNQFPIFDREPSESSDDPNRRRWNAALSGIEPAAVRFIEAQQPYKGTSGPERHVLAALRSLSNEDKHRTLVSAFTAIEGRPELVNLEVIGVRDVRSPIPGGQVHAGAALKNNDVVLEAPIEITGPNPDVKLKGILPLDFAFGRPLVPLGGLRQMVHAVAAMIRESRVFFAT